jgi:hypothetical protein
MKIAVISVATVITIGAYLFFIDVFLPKACDWFEEAMYRGPVKQNEPPTGR